MSLPLATKLMPGLVSVSFRKLTPREIVDLSLRAQLAGIEWGGDCHVPHGDLVHAREVGQMTRDAGLTVAAYGSYYRVGESEANGLSFGQVLASACALKAPLIRVWAGKQASSTANAAYRQAVVDDACCIATDAAAAGVTVSFEFHAKTLTDTLESAVELLAATAASGMRSYWQPPSGWTPAARLAALHAMMPYLTNLHVYHWQAHDRRPLADGSAEWAEYLAAVTAHTDAPRWALLEFVRHDDPEQLVADAAALRHWLDCANRLAEK